MSYVLNASHLCGARFSSFYEDDLRRFETTRARAVSSSCSRISAAKRSPLSTKGSTKGISAIDEEAEVWFVPHIAVAAHPDFEHCAALAKDITGAGRHIEGRIDELHLIDLEPERVRSLLTLPLRERNGESRCQGGPHGETA